MKGFGFIGIAAMAFAVMFHSSARAVDDFTMPHDMAWYIAALGGKVDRDRQDAEVALSILAVNKYDNLAEELKKPSFSPECSKRLKVILAREKPRNDARKARAVQFVADMKWNVDSALEAYTKFGNTNTKWDDDAKKGINLFIHGARGQQREPLEKAIQAGCDDPMVLYFEARSLEAFAPADRDAIERLYLVAMNGFEKSKYPAMRTAFAAVNCFRYKLREVEWKKPPSAGRLGPEAVAVLDRAHQLSWGNWPKVMEEKVPSQLLIHLATEILDTFDARQIDRKKPFDPMYAELEKAMPNSATLYLFKGNFYRQYAWDARGGGYANTVTPENWKLFTERLAIADEALNKAWEIDPHDDRIATEMLRVELGEHKGIDVEKKWLNRALSVNPDDLQAVSEALEYLQPRWYGSAEEVLRLGHACYASQNWSIGMPAELVHAHELLVANLPQEDQAKYFALPPVWSDIQSVYEPLLRVVPGQNSARNRYVYFAAIGGHWDVARKQFELLGQNAQPGKFGSLEEMQRMRSIAQSKSATP